MVVLWSLCDRKFLHVYRTLLSILAEFNNDVKWMVSIRPPIFNFVFHSIHGYLSNSKYLSLFSLWFSLCCSLGQQSPVYCNFSFLFVLLYKGWSSGQLLVIYLYIKILENFVLLILQGGFSFMNVVFGSMFKFHFLARFPEDHLPHSLVSSQRLLLHQFATFGYSIVNVLVPITT